MFFFRLCGINRILGLPWARDLRLPRELIKGKLWESEASRLLRTINVNNDPAPPEIADRRLDLTYEERNKADSILEKLDASGQFVAISMGGKVPVNNWGNRNWEYFLAKLSLGNPGLGAVFIGSGDERERNDLMAKAWHGPKLNSCGLLSPRETAALIERSRLFIGHDTGTLHLAAAVGTQVVGIYSAREVPGKWFTDRENDLFFYNHVECFGCELFEISECHNMHRCMTGIDVDDVVKAIKTKLSCYS